MADKIMAIREEKNRITEQFNARYGNCHKEVSRLDEEAQEVYKEFQEWVKEARLDCGDG